MIIIKDQSPHIICLQESHYNNTNTPIPIPINYQLYHNTASNRFGGVAILVHTSIQHSQTNQNSQFETIEIEIISKIKINILATYIPPNKTFTLKCLQNNFERHNTNQLILGDFNSWHQSWGSPQDNKRGRILSKFFQNTNLNILNDGSPTHFPTHNTFTHIDLSLCSSQLTPYATWKTIDDLHGSDHLPIVITLFSQPNKINYARPYFKIKKAN